MTFHIHAQPSRRAILGGIIASLGYPAHAGGDGGGGGSTFAKNPKVKSEYKQSEFSRLSRNEINQLYHNYTQKRYTLVVGFTLIMSSNLILMASGQRRRTGRLIREMGNIDDKNKRIKRLRKEQKWADDQLGLLKAALQRAKANNNKNAIEETKGQLLRINWYRDGIRAWLNAPGEGQR